MGYVSCRKLFLFVKMLGEVVPIKLIISKCSLKRQITREENFVDIGNGYSLVKFTNQVYCNRVFEGQPWFLGGQVYILLQ